MTIVILSSYRNAIGKATNINVKISAVYRFVLIITYVRILCKFIQTSTQINQQNSRKNGLLPKDIEDLILEFNEIYEINDIKKVTKSFISNPILLNRGKERIYKNINRNS